MISRVSFFLCLLELNFHNFFDVFLWRITGFEMLKLSTPHVLLAIYFWDNNFVFILFLTWWIHHTQNFFYIFHRLTFMIVFMVNEIYIFYSATKYINYDERERDKSLAESSSTTYVLSLFHSLKFVIHFHLSSMKKRK